MSATERPTPETHQDRLPPGQVPTARFPVLGERRPASLARPAAAWRLELAGRVERPLALTWAELLRLPQEDVVVDLHCVTGWSRPGSRFRGTPLRVLLERAKPRSDARFVRFLADSPRRHDSSLPLAVARADTWIVHTFDGLPLDVPHGGPLRSLTPSRYLYKSVKWLRRVELMTDDRLGFWERDQGYHNEADPWREQRYLTGDVKPADLDRLREGRRLDAFRGRLVLGVDLRGWSPVERDLRGLVLRSADLRGARLEGADLRGTNLTRSDLRGAQLRGADLRDADLEGADLRGADLGEADLGGAFLTATRLAHPDTLVGGLRLGQGRGLLESDEAFLAEAGIRPGTA